MEISKRWEYVKKFKLCFRCLGEGHQGQNCYCSRLCGLDGCQEVHHKLLHSPVVKKHSVKEDKQTTSETHRRHQSNVSSDTSVPLSRPIATATEGGDYSGEPTVKTENKPSDTTVKEKRLQ